jgi:hypothetical protein
MDTDAAKLRRSMQELNSAELANESADRHGGAMERKHSGMGIASFIISIVAGLSLFAIIVVAGVLEVSTPGGLGEDSIAAGIIGLLIIAMIFVSMVALGLGIAGLVQKNRKKIFALLGTIFSALSCVGTLTILVIGMVSG